TRIPSAINSDQTFAAHSLDHQDSVIPCFTDLPTGRWHVAGRQIAKELPMNALMSNPKLIAIALAVALLIVVAVALYMRKRKKTTAALRQRFGPEYDRAVLQQGTKGKAEHKWG